MNTHPLYSTAREVAFQEGPCLVALSEGQPSYTDRVMETHTRVDEDDSLEVVFSSATGEGRAHTPLRLNRSNTPQR